MLIDPDYTIIDTWQESRGLAFDGGTRSWVSLSEIALPAIDVQRNDIDRLFSGEPMGGTGQGFYESFQYAMPKDRDDIGLIFSHEPLGPGNYAFIPVPSADPGKMPFKDDLMSNFIANLINAAPAAVGGWVSTGLAVAASGAGALYQSYDSGGFRDAGPNFGYGSFGPGTAPMPGYFMPVDPGYGISDPGAFNLMYDQGPGGN